ncbi:deoxyribodipyrimidine photo-lyase [Wenyingzhuangia sp.]|uniref:cryptochrome/photolyase family protein n=1 Tax=Wenyingzhuangia sp. TaxID=1964193 RepID=UPI00321A4314
MKASLSIFWFRRDLRLHDNHGLFEALKANTAVLPIFIFDTAILDTLPKNDARVEFIHQQLSDINTHLQAHGSGVSLYHGTPEDVFNQLTDQYEVNTVYCNHDYEPYAIARDQKISELLNSKSISFKTFKDQVIFEKNEITKDDGLPYKVYTPFSKKWLAAFDGGHCDRFTSENLLEHTFKSTAYNWIDLGAMGFEPNPIKIAPYNVDSAVIENYEATRNFPAVNGTSKLGPHLRFGTVSVREIVFKAIQHENNTFLKELIWREFFMQILWHFPHTVTQSFKPQYDAIKWRNNTEEYNQWCAGNTGYPLVDAGMRELNQTGFMHNRVRMLVGSFLCKHLLIDWRWGEAYFAEKLHDFELSSNVSNWQWVAGCGVDAAPYFRIFNPTTQVTNFDKQHAYIKKWLPEYQDLTYPTPMVDHKFARERCLTTYKEALGKT